MKFFSFAVAALATFASLANAAPLPLSARLETGLEARASTTSTPKVPTSQQFIEQGLIKVVVFTLQKMLGLGLTPRRAQAPRKNKSLFWTGQQASTAARGLRADALELASAQDLDLLGNMLSAEALALVKGGKAAIAKLSSVDDAKAFAKEVSLTEVVLGVGADAWIQFWDNASGVSQHTFPMTNKAAHLRAFAQAFAQLSSGDITIMMEGDPSTGPQPKSDSVFTRVERPILKGRFPSEITGAFRIGTNFKTTGTKVAFKL
uniref:Uncharacterized protein n=1 Tax=Mycena chlorophos TaxID=658473 RepID=A0ABQ0LE09_MYCCL|nr:predicted protein [Mycena chlorophos]